MAKSSRSDASRTVGVWALEVLEEQLGGDWLARIGAGEGSLPPEVTQASYHAMAFAELVSMGVSL